MHGHGRGPGPAPMEAGPRRRFAMFSALQSPNYRLFWTGRVFADMGLWMQMVAQGWLVYELTNSPLFLGLTGLARAAPSLTLTLFGGVIADRMEKRRLIQLTQSANLILSFTLATLVATGLVQVWHVLVIAFLTSAVSAFDQPGRQAIMAELVDRKDLMNAVALNSASHNGTRIAGPSLAGLIIATWSLAACFYIQAAAIAVTILTLAMIRLPGNVIGRPVESMARSLASGFSYVRSQPTVLGLLAVVFVTGFFGMSYVWLLPVFARDILLVGAPGLGFLQGVSAAGALIGSLAISAAAARANRGALALGGALVFGLALTVFAMTKVFMVAAVLVFVLGVANTAYLTSTSTLLQLAAPDELRGRVMSYWSLGMMAFPALGSSAIGALADAVGTPTAVGISGVMCALCAVMVAVLAPQARRIGQPQPETTGTRAAHP